jgi:hypothetical protein
MMIQRLPAITFVKTRSKRLGWQTWRRALAGRREVNAAVAPRERRMLGKHRSAAQRRAELTIYPEDTFAQWSEASRRKAAIRST